MADLMTFVTETGQIIRGSVMGAFEDDLEQEDEQILIHAIETEAEWQRIEMMMQKLSKGPEGYGE